jgi:hypothetical protein
MQANPQQPIKTRKMVHMRVGHETMGHAEQLARRHRKRPRNCTRKASPSLRCRSCRTSLIEALRGSQFAQITRRMAQRFDLNGSARPCAVRGMNCAMPSAPWETTGPRPEQRLSRHPHDRRVAVSPIRPQRMKPDGRIIFRLANNHERSPKARLSPFCFRRMADHLQHR